MFEPPSTQDRDLVRAAAIGILDEPQHWDDPSYRRDYRQMARGTLAALDWLEGRRETAPSSHRRARPEDDASDGGAWKPSTLVRETVQTEDWGSGHVRPSTRTCISTGGLGGAELAALPQRPRGRAAGDLGARARTRPSSPGRMTSLERAHDETPAGTSIGTVVAREHRAVALAALAVRADAHAVAARAPGTRAG